MKNLTAETVVSSLQVSIQSTKHELSINISIKKLAYMKFKIRRKSRVKISAGRLKLTMTCQKIKSVVSDVNFRHEKYSNCTQRTSTKIEIRIKIRI